MRATRPLAVVIVLVWSELAGFSGCGEKTAARKAGRQSMELESLAASAGKTLAATS
jgi:hypothetical protein